MPGSTIGRGNVLVQMLLGVSLTPTALTASTTTSQTFTVQGLQTSDFVTVAFNGAQTAGVGVANAYVSAANVLTVVFSNSTASTPTPASGIYGVTVDRAENLPLPTNAL